MEELRMRKRYYTPKTVIFKMETQQLTATSFDDTNDRGTATLRGDRDAEGEGL